MTAILDRNLWTTLARVLDAPILLRIGASLAFAALASASVALAPMFLAQLVDGLAESDALGSSGQAWAFLIVLCVGRLIGHLQSYHYALSDQALQRRVSQLTFGRLILLPMSFHLAESTGSLIQTQSHALQGVRMMLALACASLLPILVQMTIVVWVVWNVFTPAIWGLVCAAIIAYTCAFAWGVQRAIAPAMIALQSQVACSGRLSDALGNIETIKTCTAEQHFNRNYSEAARDVEAAWRACSSRRLETGIATVVIFVASVGASIWLGLDGVRAGWMTAGEFLLLITYMMQIVGPLEMTGYAVRDLAQGAGYLSGLRELLSLQPERLSIGRADEGCKRQGSPPPRIDFERVSLSYDGGRAVLSDVSFSVRSGTMAAVVGATGDGKTSLLRLLQKHVSPQTGHILIDGSCVSDMETGLLRRRIAVVSQDAVLFNASLRFNLVVGRPDASEDDIRRVLRLVRLEEFVQGLTEGLETFVGDRGFKLSGGERQRVAIARALLRDADILLLDEATSALDAWTERCVFENLMAVTKDRTIVVVTHRLALATAAENVLVLQNGQVAEQGSHSRLMAAKGVYFRLWSKQNDLQA